MNRARSIYAAAFLALAAAATLHILDAAAPKGVPRFEADPSWPKIPNGWIFGETSGVAVDNDDNIWVLQRPRTVQEENKAHVAPAVLEFDVKGKLIRAWGGPGDGYEWPDTEHGIYVDYKGFVWIAGSGAHDDQLLKFTKEGKFVMQIGHAGQSKGNADTQNVHMAADVFLEKKTNELYVADGYGNRRVIVFDADTGAFRRMWGAFGNVPTDPPAGTGRGRGRGRAAQDASAPDPIEVGRGPEQFNLVHGARVSNDGQVYVSDRSTRRFQIFQPDGTFVQQVFIDRYRKDAEKALDAPGGDEKIFTTTKTWPCCEAMKDLRKQLYNAGQTASRTAFSPDKDQRFLYVINRIQQQIFVYDRKTLEVLESFGETGHRPGQFYVLHDLAVDSKGNIYTAEVNLGARAQKMTFKGMK
jgi:DNA-binding beta-propeller fold protein YncE